MAPSGGAATGAGTRSDVTLKLTQLQNFCKRDPIGYKEDYDAQVRRLESEVGILALQPSTEPSPRLVELIQFAAAVSSSSYQGQESERIARMLMNLLIGNAGADSSINAGYESNKTDQNASAANVNTMPSAALQLHREVRKTSVSALILMRNKGVIEPLRLLELFFRIMAVVPDKALRELLYRHMVNDIRNINKKGRRDEKVNRSVQSFLHRVVSLHGSASSDAASHQNTNDMAATDIASKRATDMVCELYRRRVWTDDRTVAILASAVQSKNTTTMSRAIRFFLGIEEKMARDEKDRTEVDWENSNRIDYHSHSKKTCSRKRQTIRALKNRKKVQQKKEMEDWMEAETPENDRGVEASKHLYPAMEMLRDPQGLAEAVFKRLRSSGSCKFETKMLMMNFVTRLVGNHELMLLPLYPFLQKYMGGHQRDVTAVLAYTVQACHSQVPPEEVYGILKTISHNFITERCSEEQMAVGINAARAICARVPSVLSVEETNERCDLATSGTVAMDIEAFVRDLAAYSNHRDRSVSIAGKSFTNFMREVHPALLQGKHRGLKGTALHKAGEKPLRYGEQRVSQGVEGADLLAEYEAKKAAKKARGVNGEDDNDDSTEEEEDADGWEEVEGGDAMEGDVGVDGWEDVAAEECGDDEAPDLVLVGGEAKATDDADNERAAPAIDLSKMSGNERNKLKQDVSSNRVFTAAEFQKMRQLVERENRAKRDPREAARRKRAIARGEDLEEYSDDDDSDDERIRISGAVNPEDIMADAKRKRQSKAEKLEKIVAGRSAFETKGRAGGSTNIEKSRKKNFLMSKNSREARSKGRGKGDLRKKRNGTREVLNHEAKKRRRK